MFYIETKRLRLIPLSHKQLQLLSESRQKLEESLGLNISSMKMDAVFEAEINDALHHFWLPKTKAYPDKFEWYTSWEIVLKESNTIIGGIGFGGYPESGSTEIGFMIDKNHHGRGYGGEALEAMTDWAFANSAAQTIIAHTETPNAAAQKVLLRAGFNRESDDGTIITFKLAK
jgi:[ribosomal protein S5]-alanine N-acetyltransferase